jgi:hypothetical protein
MEEEKKQKPTMYECAKLFIETMDHMFPDANEDSAVFLLATDGKKVSSMFNGDDSLIRQTLSYFIVNDEDIKNIVGNSLVAAYRYLNNQKEEHEK